MFIREELMKRLEEFGLNSYEGKLWTSLLSRGVSSAGELSDIANVPRSRTYDVLESLEKKGFIMMKLGKPIKYMAVSPEEVIERMKKKVKEETDTHTSFLEEFRNGPLLDELNQLHSQGVQTIDPAELSGALRGRKHLYNHYEMLAKNSSKQILLMTTQEGLLRKMHKLYTPLQKAAQRNITIKIAANIDKEYASKLQRLTNIATVRHTDSIQGRFMVADQQDVVYSLSDGENVHHTYDGGIWTSAPFFAQTLSTMFHRLWDDMTPLEKL